MFRLTFGQSEKVTDSAVDSIVKAIGDKKRVTWWYFIKHFLALSVFNIFILVVLIEFMYMPKSFNFLKIYFYDMLCFMIFVSIGSFVLFSILAVTKSVIGDYILSGIVFYSEVFVIFVSLVALIFIFFIHFDKTALDLSTIGLFYTFVIVLALFQCRESYVDFKNKLGVSRDKADIRMQKFDHFVKKYGGSLFIIINIINVIKRLFGGEIALGRSAEILIAMFIVFPIMIYLIIYWTFFALPCKSFPNIYYFLKYKKEYQKKILDEYQIDFCGWEKHKKK